MQREVVDMMSVVDRYHDAKDVFLKCNERTPLQERLKQEAELMFMKASHLLEVAHKLEEIYEEEEG